MSAAPSNPHDDLHPWGPHVAAEAGPGTDLPKHCLCVCRKCFYRWTYTRPGGGFAFVGICICRYCPCSQRKIADDCRFATVINR